MDDDDTRRGRPTVHKAFDEATAILAGDTLLTLAFDVMADPATHPVRRGARGARAGAGAGLRARRHGRRADARSRGGRALRADGPRVLAEADIRLLQAMKTGALLAASVEIGALLGAAREVQRAALSALRQGAGRSLPGRRRYPRRRGEPRAARQGDGEGRGQGQGDAGLGARARRRQARARPAQRRGGGGAGGFRRGGRYAARGGAIRGRAEELRGPAATHLRHLTIDVW